MPNSRTLQALRLVYNGATRADAARATGISAKTLYCYMQDRHLTDRTLGRNRLGDLVLEALRDSEYLRQTWMDGLRRALATRTFAPVRSTGCTEWHPRRREALELVRGGASFAAAAAVAGVCPRTVRTWVQREGDGETVMPFNSRKGDER